MPKYQVNQELLLDKNTPQDVKLAFSNAQSLEKLNGYIQNLHVQVSEVETIMRIMDFLAGVNNDLIAKLIAAKVLVEEPVVQSNPSPLAALNLQDNQVKVIEPQKA